MIGSKTAGQTAGPLTDLAPHATESPLAGVAQSVERQLPNVTPGTGEAPNNAVSCEDSQGTCTAADRGIPGDAAETAGATAGDPFADLATIAAELARTDTPEARFLDALAMHGTVIAHPDTIAALDAREPGWREALGVREAIPCAYMSPEQMIAGRFTGPTAAERWPAVPVWSMTGPAPARSERWDRA